MKDKKSQALLTALSRFNREHSRYKKRLRPRENCLTDIR